jgi:hypothetical protein
LLETESQGKPFLWGYKDSVRGGVTRTLLITQLLFVAGNTGNKPPTHNVAWSPQTSVTPQGHFHSILCTYTNCKALPNPKVKKGFTATHPVSAIRDSSRKLSDFHGLQQSGLRSRITSEPLYCTCYAEINSRYFVGAADCTTVGGNHFQIGSPKAIIASR